MMKKINFMRLLLDMVMLAAFICLMNLNILALGLHERIGLLSVLMVAGHLLLNRKQLVILLKKITAPKLPRQIRLNYLIDCLLLPALILLVISGLGISRSIMPMPLFDQQDFWLGAHHFLGYFTLVLVIIHLLLHRKWLHGMHKQLHKTANTGKGKLGLLTAILCLLALFGGVAYLNDHLIFSDSRGNGSHGGRQELPISAEVSLTAAELAQYNGQDGRPSYIAVDGLIYDVSQYFIDGRHFEGIHAGMDLSGLITRRKCQTALTHCPVVGKLNVSPAMAVSQSDNSTAEQIPDRKRAGWISE